MLHELPASCLILYLNLNLALLVLCNTHQSTRSYIRFCAIAGRRGCNTRRRNWQEHHKCADSAGRGFTCFETG